MAISSSGAVKFSDSVRTPMKVVATLFMAGALAFVALARFGLGAGHASAGAATALFAGAIAVAELAVGLAMAALIYREQRSFALDAARG